MATWRINGLLPIPELLSDVDAMYAIAGKPIHITELGLPSAQEDEPNQHNQRATFPWHGDAWTETMQADWIEQFYTLCYAHPAVRAVQERMAALVEPLLNDSESAYLIVDDSVQNKQYSRQIGLVQRQYSGAEHDLVRGIDIVNLVHYDGQELYPIDYRICAPKVNGLTKNALFAEMLMAAKHSKGIKAQTVLFDSWYRRWTISN